MNKQFQQVKDDLNRLSVLQEHHIDSFQTELMPDIESQIDERDNEFIRFKEDINNFLTQAHIETDIEMESMNVYVADHITTLLEQNRRLEIKVKEHREQLKKRMTQVTKGKKAIGFYGSANVAGSKPKIISSTR